MLPGELHDRICRTLIAASFAHELLHVLCALAKRRFVRGALNRLVKPGDVHGLLLWNS
jgi:hypothetical protein